MKRISREQKWQIAREELINKMFEIAGHPVTYEDIKDRRDNWFQQWTMTVEESEEWKSWGSDYLRKHLKLNKAMADREMLWANVQWGLMYSNYEETQSK
jgi:hypothetical protein